MPSNQQIINQLKKAGAVIHDGTQKKKTLKDLVDAHTPAPQQEPFERKQSNEEILTPVIKLFGGNKGFTLVELTVVCAILLVFAIPVLLIIAGFYNKQSLTDKVVKTERIQQCSGNSCTSKYLVFGEKEVYQNTDTLIFLKYNSSDLYAKIEQGQICKFTVYGWRIPFFSSYRNILDADCKKGKNE